MKTSNKLKISACIILIASVAAAYIFTPLGEYLSIEKVIEVTKDIPESPLTAGLFLLIFFVGGALLVPTPLMAFALSLIFSTWISVLLAIPGFLLACSSGYIIGRLIDDDTFGDRVQGHIDTVSEKVEDKGAWAVLALRVAPTPPFTVTSVISGILKIHPAKYALGSVLGIMPLGLSAIFFGRGAMEMMQNPSGIAVSTLVAAVIFLVMFFVIKQKKRSSS